MPRRGIGHASLLAKVPSISIEYCEVYKIPSSVGFPQVLGPLFLPTHENVQHLAKSCLVMRRVLVSMK